MIRARGRTVSTVRSLVLAVLACGLFASAAFAGVSNFTLGGTRIKSTEGINYSATVPISNGTAANVDVVANFTGSGEGTKIIWKISGKEGNIGTATINNAQTSTVAINGASSLQAMVAFNSVSVSDSFEVTAQLAKDDGGSDEPLGGIAHVTITFFQQKPLTGVSISHTNMKLRKLSPNVTLTAKPIPADATSPSWSWSTGKTNVITTTGGTNNAQIEVSAYSQANVGDKDKIVVRASSSSGETFYASCDVEIVDEKTLDDGMRIDTDLVSPTTGSNTSQVYRVDEYYLKHGSDVELSSDTIESQATVVNQSGADNGKVVLIGDIAGDKIAFNGNRSGIANALGLTDDTRNRLVTAMNVSFDVRETQAHRDGKNVMLPSKVEFVFPDGLKTLGSGTDDPRELDPKPSSPSVIRDNYNIMKYFGSADNAINITELLERKGKWSYIGDRSQISDYPRFPLVPLVVFVDALAPTRESAKTSGVEYAWAGDSNQFGAAYDRLNKVLYIYDGSRDGYVKDPLTLERKPQYSGGGGGGGCDALGGTAVALVVLVALGAAARSRRK